MLKFLQVTKKYSKLLISILILLVIVTGAFTYIAFAPFQNDKPINAIKSAWFDPATLANNRSNFPTTVFEEDILVKPYDYKFTQTKFDIFKPKYTYLGFLKNNGDRKYVRFLVIQLNRDGLWDWKVSSYKEGELRNLSLSEASTLASKYDITTNFPGKENYKITNYETLSDEQIEANRKLREEDEAQKRVQQEFQADTLEGALKLCQDDIEEAKQLVEAAKRGDKTFQAKRLLVIIDQNKIPAYEKDVADLIKYCQNPQ